MASLAVEFRPQKFEDVCGQTSIIKILRKQLETDNLSNTYIFSGPSGCGKTTMARIFAKEINKYQLASGEWASATPIEIDGASNNGVDNVKNIIKDANERSIEGKYKVYVVDECVTGDTEVLTDEGWKRFDSLSKSEKIAQYTEAGKIEFVTPTEYIERDYSGDMYSVKIGNKATFIMSPNHVQPLYYVKSKKIREKYIKDTKFCASNKLIRSGHGVGELDTLSKLDRLAIALQADGTLQNSGNDYNYWTIKVKKEIKQKRLLSILEDSGVSYKIIKPSAEGLLRLSLKTPKDITKQLQTHFSLDNMSSNYASELIDEIMCWDGYHPSGSKYFYYSSVIKENVDFCQCVGVLCGYKSRTAVEKDLRKETYKDVHRIYLQKDELGTPNQTLCKEVIEFSGKIYCVKVPSHMIIIRKDGFEMVTGNCHMLTVQAWNAFLKCIEEPPKFTIFIFCTTDPQKIPATIINRCMKFNFTRLSSNQVRDRLQYICEATGHSTGDAGAVCEYISRISNGQARDAISMLEKCFNFDPVLSLDNALIALGTSSYKTMFDLLNSLIDCDDAQTLSKLNEIYNNGNDIKIFIDQFLSFVLDVTKYLLMNDISVTRIPSNMKGDLERSIKINNAGAYYNYLATRILDLKNLLKNDTDPLSTASVKLLGICRCQ